MASLRGGLPVAVALEMAAEPAQQRAQQRVARVHRVAGEGHLRAEEGLHLRVGPAGHVVGQSALAGVAEVVHPAHEVQVVLARVGVGEADVLVDQLAIVLVAEVPADHPALAAVDEHHAAAGRVLQQQAEEARAEAVEVDAALRVHVVEQRMERGQRRLVAEAGVAGAQRLDLKIGARAQLAPDVLPAAVAEPRQVLVVRTEVDRHVGQRLAFQQHEALVRAGRGEGARVGVGRLVQQRRILCDVLHDQEPALAPEGGLQPLRQRRRCHARRQRRVLGHGGAGEAGAPAQQPAPVAMQRQRGHAAAQRVVGRGQQVERRHEGRHALRRMVHREAERRFDHERGEQRVRFQLRNERHA
ncbi:hypothetical protein RLIN73S_03315 [Rhodanobacter lindaniclasticus]